MTDKINIIDIVKDHCATFTNSGGKCALIDYIFFYGVPLVFAVVLFRIDVKVSPSSIDIMLSAVAILTGLLFNLLVLLLNSKDAKQAPKSGQAPKKGDGSDVASQVDAGLTKSVITQTFSNVSYCIFIGIAFSIISIAGLADGKNGFFPYISAVISFLGAHFALTLLMILKRMHSLFTEEVKG